jgi:hypothetical protein
MDAIITTSQTGTLYETDEVKNWAPFCSSSGLYILRKLTQNRVIWVTTATFANLPTSFCRSPHRAFRLLSTRGTQNKAYNGLMTYTFDQLEKSIDNLNGIHILMGGHQAYKRLLPSCQNVFWSTVHQGHPSPFTRQVTLDPSIIKESHKYGQILYEDTSCCYRIYSRSLKAKSKGVEMFERVTGISQGNPEVTHDDRWLSRVYDLGYQ